MEPVTTLVAQLALLAQAIITPGMLYARTLVLYAAPVTVNKNLTFAMLTVATFTGYANSVGLVFGTPYIDVNGRARTDAPSIDFQMTDTVTPNTIYGWALCNVGLTEVVLAANLANPIPLTIALQGLSIQPTYAYGD